MVVRLAFAVAIHAEPEILLVDEALAVGDTYFRHRCMRKVHELRARGVTIVFVSHSSADVKAIGERALWLRHGQAVALGDIDDVLDRYLAAMTAPSAEPSSPQPPQGASANRLIRSIPNVDQRHGDGRAEFLGVAVLNEYEEPLHLMMPDSKILVRLSLQASKPLARPDVGFVLRNHLGLDFAEVCAAGEGRPLPRLRPGEIVTVDFLVEIPELYPGSFSFTPWIISEGSVCDWIDNAVTVQMGKGEGYVYGYVQWPVRVEMNAVNESPEPRLV